MRSSIIVLLLSVGLACPEVVPAQSAEEGEEESAGPRTLFERAGGTYVLAQAVDDFVDALLADPAIRANSAVRQATRATRRAGLKFQITSLLCQEAGGPCKYQGRSLRESHMGLGISSREWGVMIWTFKRALVRAGVPPAERQELVNILETSKGDIVSVRRR